MRAIGTRWRAAAALYLTVFLLAVAAAPHDHLNGLEDLLLDQPSDSGEIVETDAASPLTSGAPIFEGFSVVDDIPCLACFGSDFVSDPAPVIHYTPILDRVVLRAAAGRARFLPRIVRESLSRGPPSTL